jgi:lysophosphatidate acyltransferase
MQMPILPVVVSSYDFHKPKEKIFDAGTAKVKILEPVSIEGYSKENIDDLITKVRNKMLAELSSMSGNKYQ